MRLQPIGETEAALHPVHSYFENSHRVVSIKTELLSPRPIYNCVSDCNVRDLYKFLSIVNKGVFDWANIRMVESYPVLFTTSQNFRR